MIGGNNFIIVRCEGKRVWRGSGVAGPLDGAGHYGLVGASPHTHFSLAPGSGDQPAGRVS